MIIKHSIYTYTHTHCFLLHLPKYQQTKKRRIFKEQKNFSSFSVCRNCCGIICKCTSNEKDDDDPYGTGKDDMMYKTCECFYDMTKFITFFFQVFVITQKKNKILCSQIHIYVVCCMCLGKDVYRYINIYIENMKER